MTNKIWQILAVYILFCLSSTNAVAKIFDSHVHFDVDTGLGLTETIEQRMGLFEQHLMNHVDGGLIITNDLQLPGYPDPDGTLQTLKSFNAWLNKKSYFFGLCRIEIAIENEKMNFSEKAIHQLVKTCLQENRMVGIKLKLEHGVSNRSLLIEKDRKVFEYVLSGIEKAGGGVLLVHFKPKELYPFPDGAHYDCQNIRQNFAASGNLGAVDVLHDLAKKYSKVAFILAHSGQAFNQEVSVLDYPHLRDLKNIFIETSGIPTLHCDNTHSDISLKTQYINEWKTYGWNSVLYGSDFTLGGMFSEDFSKEQAEFQFLLNPEEINALQWDNSLQMLQKFVPHKLKHLKDNL